MERKTKRIDKKAELSALKDYLMEFNKIVNFSLNYTK